MTSASQRGEKRLRHKEFLLPIVVGTQAFSLGKKVRACFWGLPEAHAWPGRINPCHVNMQATPTQTHRWNLYVRGIDGMDISHIVKKVSMVALCMHGGG